jgi:Domain of unknown function (DUF6456)
MAVIISETPEKNLNLSGFALSYTCTPVARGLLVIREKKMQNRVLVERLVRDEGQHGGAQQSRRVTINLAESPLNWLAARGLVNERQLLAGETLRRDFDRAGLGPRVTMQWDAPPHGKTARSAINPGAATLTQIDAKRRFDAAIEAAGPGLCDILWRVVCAGESIPIAEKGLGWPARAGRLVLSLALDRLAAFYKVA